ncbi:RluA family pseudouridine synthase [Comamonas composti]|uniref:RluA family pseudouridine synthase n=1 Tax=Comamonas composti TaxID=408558 RepID=UPI0003F56A4E|nr:RluA family pseudouridine synthase [Comamonas composti]
MNQAPDFLRCLYADDDLLVLDKPSGLLCVPGRGPDKQDCLSARAASRWADALVVHRLDQATSGLVLMARNPPGQRRLSQDFAERRVHKRYAAVVHGRPPAKDCGLLAPASETASACGPEPGWHCIDLPIAADWERRPLRIIDAERGKPSQTLWRTMEQMSPDRTRVELQPLTGRTHQLRLHLAAIGHPILGDALYAPPQVQQAATRLLLHAQALEFAHPATGAWMRFEAAADF